MHVVIPSIGSFSGTPASLKKDKIAGFAKMYLMTGHKTIHRRPRMNCGVGVAPGTPASAEGWIAYAVGEKFTCWQTGTNSGIPEKSFVMKHQRRQ